MKKYKSMFKYDRKHEFITSHLQEAMNVDNHTLKVVDLCRRMYHKKKVFKHKCKKGYGQKSLSFESIKKSESCSSERVKEKSSSSYNGFD